MRVARWASSCRGWRGGCAQRYLSGAGGGMSAGKIRATREREVVEALGAVVEPLSRQKLQDIAAIQGVKVENDSVFVDLDFFVPGYPLAEEVKQKCQSVIKREIPWMNDITFSVSKGSYSSDSDGSAVVGVANSLRKVKHVIGVSSCKGGVGKSTTAVNLAVTLAQRGLSIGLLDADVYGPSLPLLLKPDEIPVVVRKDPENPKCVLPLVVTMKGLADSSENGIIKFLSFGHVNPKAGVAGAGGEGAAVIRGPIVSRVINQLIANTTWGELDYLIVDMPPGTGDIQITLNQSMSMTGSIIVTTPHPLAVVDVLKGHQMMQSMHVPTLVLVENMSHFTCDLGKHYFPFGKLDRKSLQEQLSSRGIKSEIPVVSFPLTSTMSCQYDVTNKGDIINNESKKEVEQSFNRLADSLIEGVFKIQLEAQLLPQVTYNKAKCSVLLRYYTASEAIEYEIPTAVLRYRDAATGLALPSVEESPTLKASLLKGTVFPVSFDLKGNYGVSIVWSDGHFADIYPFSVLKHIAAELKS